MYAFCLLASCHFPAGRGLFSFAFTMLTSGKRDLCHGSKFPVLSIPGGYLATESLQSADISWGMCFEQRRPVSTHGRGLFPAMVNPANGKKEDLCSSRESVVLNNERSNYPHFKTLVRANLINSPRLNEHSTKR